MQNVTLYHAGIKGMKWGVRRYQNKDGSLTDAGRRRYARDQRENAGKKKGNKVGAADPDRWVREDMERTKRVTDSASTMANRSASEIRSMKKSHKRMDLSKMSDQELRDRINRENLEQQYDRMFGEKETISKGQRYAANILETTGTALAATSSALAIALAIKELRG